jgi:hypothetical protein
MTYNGAARGAGQGYTAKIRENRASTDGSPMVPDALLAHTTPLSCEHIGLSRVLRDRAAAAAEKKRPLNRGPPQDPA